MQEFYSFEPSSDPFTALKPSLDVALVESNAQGAYVYAVDPQNTEARLLLWSGLPPATPLEVQGPAVRTAFSRTTPLVIHESAWNHASFEPLPEFRKNRFEGAVSVPLLVESAQIVGFLNVCRSERAPFKPREFWFLLSLGVPVGALLAASTAQLHLKQEIEKLTRQLADRKLLERAKGVIQSRFECTEEQAYFCIRNLSRRRRAPMRQIAQEVIHTAAEEIQPLEDAQ
jgi:signal transduction protein with GAF and PtsI domain